MNSAILRLADGPKTKQDGVIIFCRDPYNLSLSLMKLCGLNLHCTLHSLPIKINRIENGFKCVWIFFIKCFNAGNSLVNVYVRGLWFMAVDEAYRSTFLRIRE